MWYKLIHRKTVPYCHTISGNMDGFLKEYAKYFNNFNKRKVRSKWIGPIHISTVFLGLNHSNNNESPRFFETMIFDGENNYQTRCSTWREALRMHRKAVALVRAM